MERYRDDVRFIPCECGHDKTWHQQTYEGNAGGCEHKLGTDEKCKCPKFRSRRFHPDKEEEDGYSRTR